VGLSITFFSSSLTPLSPVGLLPFLSSLPGTEYPPPLYPYIISIFERASERKSRMNSYTFYLFRLVGFVRTHPSFLELKAFIYNNGKEIHLGFEKRAFMDRIEALF
jgi:hypothetical protein